MRSIKSALLGASTVVLALAATPVVQAATLPAPSPTPADRSVDPCNNFFEFACGIWIKNNPIPADQSRWGRFNELALHNREALHELLDEAVAHPTADNRKVADYYGACMNEGAIDAKGLDPLKDVFAKIDALADKKQLAPLVAHLHLIGVNVFFSSGVDSDAKDSNHYLAQVDQGGLGLPDRDYYFKTDEKSVKQREAYQAHVSKMLALAGATPEAAEAGAKAVLAVETGLAKDSLNRVKRRDPSNVYHKLPLGDLDKLAGGFQWAAYLKEQNFPAFKNLNIAEPDFLKGLDGVIAATSLDDIKTYLRWQTLHRSAKLLSKAFVEEDFSFYGKVLSGAKELEPRWRRCVVATDRALGEALGKVYVAKYFPPEADAKMKDLIKDLRAAYDEDMAGLSWMGPETRKKAREKLAVMVDKVGHPEKWRDYTLVDVKADDALGNAFRATAFENDRQLKRVGKQVDRREWLMTPPTVNAYYDPSHNDINFPAGILQPPFFDPAGDDAANYGAIGAVIGHEMTHGFDDEGRLFDKDGNLKDFWTKKDAESFKERASCIANQYSGYTAVDDVKINGQLTLGENTADNGGVRIALAALKKHLKGKKTSEIDGFTPEQRFFLAYAGVWCSASRPEAARTQALTDPHSAERFRVQGVVDNMPEFAEAFHCPVKPVADTKSSNCRVW